MALEQQVVCRLATQRTVVATGGSVIYSETAMAHLRQLGRPLDTLQQRVWNLDSRGLVIDPGETFADLYARRTPLYRRHAELTIRCGERPPEAIAAAIEEALCGALPT